MIEQLENTPKTPLIDFQDTFKTPPRQHLPRHFQDTSRTVLYKKIDR
jgi:hypothetical protein